MKTINLKDISESVKKLALKKKRTYFTVRAEMGEYLYNDGTFKPVCNFILYVDGYGFHEGKTPTEALVKLKYAMFPSKQPIPNVEVAV
jgi:hypothetical protein